jgi:hypothetical protein
MIIAGIDWSLTSPSVCIYDSSNNKPFHFNSCIISVVNDRSHIIGRRHNVKIYPHYNWSKPEERYHTLAIHFLPELIQCDVIYLEDYAYAAKGKVFNLAESTGILKYNLWVSLRSYQTIFPATVKKFATGKGNANKELMYEAFVEDTDVNLLDELDAKNINSPISDIVDSYFICKFAFFNTK